MSKINNNGSQLGPLYAVLKIKILESEVLVAQLGLTLCDPVDCSLPGSSNTGMSCHSLLQEIFPTQGLNLSLLHCRQILYH